MKKWWLLIVILLLIPNLVIAFSKENSLKWLQDNINYQTSTIEETSFTLLSLGENNLIKSQDPNYIIFQQRKDSNNCYPKGSCNTKDTSLAALTYSKFNTQNSDLLNWLKTSISKANVEDWYIQIQTSSSGKCTIIYDDNKEKIVNVNGLGKLSIEGQPGEFDWISVKNNLGVNLDNPIEEIIVDCTKPVDTKIDDPSMLVSLLRITNNNEFHIYQEAQGRTATLEINNACYANVQGGQCDKDASFYAAWSLNRIGQDVTVLPYLESSASTDKDYAMLLSITGDQRYAQYLVDSQHTLGYWGNQDILTTSYAINALTPFTQYGDEITKAKTWLESKQITSEVQNNGSFGSLLNTGVATYLVFTQGTSITPPPLGNGSSPYCGDFVTDSGEECDDGNNLNGDGCSSTCRIELGQCTFSTDCGQGNVCDSGTCVAECITNDNCPTEKPICDIFSGICKSSSTGDVCDNDGICDSNEDQNSCPADCGSGLECTSNLDCGQGQICDASTGRCQTESTGSNGCTSDNDCSSGEQCNLNTGQCETQKSNTLFWASLVIIIAILAIGGYFAYTRLVKKPRSPQQPPFLGSQPDRIKQKPNYAQPRQPQRQPYGRSKVDESLERELDKSIKEAERLLKK